MLSLSRQVALWRTTRQTKILPTQSEIAVATAKVGWRKMQLDARANFAVATQNALQVLAAHNITRALVELGGDIAVGAPPPNQFGWRIETPDQNVWLLHDCALSSAAVLMGTQAGKLARKFPIIHLQVLAEKK